MVDADDEDAARGEGGEEGVVAVDVVAVAVDEEEFGDGWCCWLELCFGVSCGGVR